MEYLVYLLLKLWDESKRKTEFAFLSEVAGSEDGSSIITSSVFQICQLVTSVPFISSEYSILEFQRQVMQKFPVISNVKNIGTFLHMKFSFHILNQDVFRYEMPNSHVKLRGSKFQM